MQKYKYALDLEENIYSLTSDFDTYKLNSNEINKLHSVPISDNDSNYIGKEIVYDHTYIYLTPKEFIEQHKLSNDKKTELYKNIGKIKIKEINPENIKDISFILHHILKMKAQEEVDVQAYEMPISSSWQYIPFNQRINFGIENVFNRQNNATNTQKNLDNYISINIQETVFLSDESTNNSEQKEKTNLNDFSNGLFNFGLNDSNQSQITESESQYNRKFDYDRGIQEVNNEKKTVNCAADLADIEPSLLYGILVSERMRYDKGDWLADRWYEKNTKGFAQISTNAATEGENYYRQQHDLSELTDDEKKKMGDSIQFSNNANIHCAARYISYLQSLMPKNISDEERNRLVAAAYKAGPTALKNTRMQQQLNDLLKLNLSTDGDPGGKTNEAICNLLSSNTDKLIKICRPNFTDFNINDIAKFTTITKRKKDGTIDYANAYHASDYEKIRKMVNELWKLNNPGKDNPIYAIPTYETTNWTKDMQTHLEDVFKAKEEY